MKNVSVKILLSFVVIAGNILLSSDDDTVKKDMLDKLYSIKEKLSSQEIFYEKDHDFSKKSNKNKSYKDKWHKEKPQPCIEEFS